MSGQDVSGRSMRLGVAVVVTAALALRWSAAWGELWMDGIWSLLMVRQMVHQSSDVVLTLKHDNNHFLNSLWIYWLPESVPDFAYRLLSVVSGTVSVLLAVLIARRQGIVVASVTAVVVLTSYLQVHYSSEARGYATLC